MSLTELAQNGQVILGFMLALLSAMTVVGAWFWNNVSSRVKSETSTAFARVDAPAREMAVKVTKIETEVDEMASDLHSVKGDVKMLSGRLHKVERSMETVARQADVAELNAELKLLTGSVTTELRALSGTIHSFREAALRASEKGNGK